MGFCSLALVAGEQWCFCNSYQANGAAAAANLNSSLLLPKFYRQKVTSSRSNMIMTRSNKVSVQASKAKSSSNYTQNIAHLTGTQKEGYIVPSYKHKSWKKYPISEFLSHPSAIEAILKSDATQTIQHLGSNNYRLKSQVIELLKYEIIPVFDRRVIPTTEDCTFEMLSCTGSLEYINRRKYGPSIFLLSVMGFFLQFEGSEEVKSNKGNFSAYMRNHITWDTHCPKESEPCLDVEMTLGISFEVSELPFSLLPLSFIETPGNLLIQAQVNNHARLLIKHLLLHYDKWVLSQG